MSPNSDRSSTLTRLLCIIAFMLTQPCAARPFETQHWQTTRGTHVIFHPSMEVPMLDIGIAFAAGSAYDGDKFGLSTLTTQLLNQGNEGQDAAAIADQLAETGAQFAATNNQEMIVLCLRTLTRPDTLQQASKTFSLIVNRPDFPLEAFNREKNVQLMTIKQSQEVPEMIAQNTFFQVLYRQHPYAHPIEGNYNTVNALRVEHVRHFYQQYFVANNAVIAMVGAIDSATAHELAEQITRHLPAGLPAPAIPAAQPLTEEMNIVVKYPSSQTMIRLGQLGISHHDSDFFPLQVGNYILGGDALDSRLEHELRGKRGFTYGVNSHFSPMPGIGPFVIGFSTKRNQAIAAMDVTRKTLASFIKTGPTDAELTTAKHYLTGSFPLSLASNRSIVEILLKIAFYHLPSDFLTTYMDHVNAVSVTEIKLAFQHKINPNQLLNVSVGRD